MGNGEAQVEKERLVSLLPDPFHRLGEEQVVAVLVLLPGIVLQFHRIAVSPEPVNIEVMGIALVVVPEEVIEADLVGVARAVTASHSPFADACRAVARSLGQPREGHFALPQRLLPRRALVAHLDGAAIGLGIVDHAGMTGVLARHEDAAGRRADGGARIVVRETHALGRHPVEIRRSDYLLAVAAQIAVSQVVGQDVDDVGATAGIRSGRDSSERRGRSARGRALKEVPAIHCSSFVKRRRTQGPTSPPRSRASSRRGRRR